MSDPVSFADSANPSARGCPPELTLQAPTEEDPVFRGPDRRRRATPRLSRHTLLGGRRRWVRRDELQRILGGAEDGSLKVPPPIAIAHQLMRTWAEREDR